MNIAMILIGGLIFLSFPVIVLQKIKKMKQENTDEAKKKLNLFLICMMPADFADAFGACRIFRDIIERRRRERVCGLHIGNSGRIFILITEQGYVQTVSQ